MRGDQTSAREFHPGLQWLRAAAALMVVCHHLGFSRALSGAAQGWLLRITEPMSAGVDLFFVISGFVMAKCWTARELLGPGGFLLRRWVRVLPLYWLCTCGVFAAAAILPRETVAGQSAGVLNGLFSFLLIPTGSLPPLKVGWSLVFENYFYLVFAVILFLPARWRLPAVCVWGAGTLGLYVAVPDFALLSAGGLLSCPLTLEFIGGVIIGARIEAFRPLWERPAVTLLFTGLFVVSVFGQRVSFPVESTNRETLQRLFQWGVPAMLLVASMAAPGSSGRFAGARWALLLGDASYAMYLVHLFVLALVGRLLVPAGEGDAHGWLWRYPLCLGAVIGVSLGVHLLLEKPLHKALLERLCRRAAKAA